MSPNTKLVVGTERIEKIVQVLLNMPWLSPMHVRHGTRMGEIEDVEASAIELIGKASPDFD